MTLFSNPQWASKICLYKGREIKRNSMSGMKPFHGYNLCLIGVVQNVNKKKSLLLKSIYLWEKIPVYKYVRINQYETWKLFHSLR